jgi:hypothetical protein
MKETDSNERFCGLILHVEYNDFDFVVFAKILKKYVRTSAVSKKQLLQFSLLQFSLLQFSLLQFSLLQFSLC